MSSAKGQCHFKLEWLDLQRYPEFFWLKDVAKSNCLAYCTYCRTEISLKSMGISALRPHEEGKTHKSNVSTKTKQRPLFSSVSPKSQPQSMTIRECDKDLNSNIVVNPSNLNVTSKNLNIPSKNGSVTQKDLTRFTAKEQAIESEII
ncbi:hypothetical protein QAD02_020246 [Eretmocerus hayati]|uniref:Uncharacterized protein n=1 Tax=Eretmocerus hayati TaxID=131215 RepID=A0ACC2PPC9_9HYME|nr:hypothetical protein QAD02_020246 [Eretmocerus hayati]